MIAMDDERPDITAIVVPSDGTEAMRRCIEALEGQTGDLRLEILVPVLKGDDDHARLSADFPGIRCLSVEADTHDSGSNDFIQHYHMLTILRSHGVKAARGRIVGLLHDRAVPHTDWALSMAELHQEQRAVAVGGCIDNGINTTWHWAVHFYDFARYMPPQPMQETQNLSITNVCYDADALAAIADVYDTRFLELEVHDALNRSGGRMILSDRPLVTEFRPRMPIGTLAKEWLTWGRKYAGFQMPHISTGTRLWRILSAPLVPFVLFVRQFRVQREKRAHMRHFWPAAPLLFLIVTMWSLGELAGYAIGPFKEIA